MFLLAISFKKHKELEYDSLQLTQCGFIGQIMEAMGLQPKFIPPIRGFGRNQKTWQSSMNALTIAWYLA